jgi:hypothetical protein
MKPYLLFLDDMRTPAEAWTYMKLPVYVEEEWITVRSFDAFADELQSRFDAGYFPTLISFDHDLADVHYSHLDENIPYDSFSERTGLHCARYLIDFCLEKELRLPQFIVHSMNPVGKVNITRLLQQFRDSQGE